MVSMMATLVGGGRDGVSGTGKDGSQDIHPKTMPIMERSKNISGENSRPSYAGFSYFRGVKSCLNGDGWYLRKIKARSDDFVDFASMGIWTNAARYIFNEGSLPLALVIIGILALLLLLSWVMTR